jgi:CubicO group peptidase (beta-lactamase class C family)
MKRFLVGSSIAAATFVTAAASHPDTDLGRRTSVVGRQASDLARRTSDVDARAVDALFSDYTRAGSPGCAVGVFQNGAIAFAKGYGLASVEHDVPITPDTVFYAGSVSKQFTAMTAALAIRQGKLSYDDSIRRYLPELPAYADRIKVSHLLHHTSGLRDYNTLLAVAGRRDEDAWDNAAVLRITARQKALNFEPGAEYLYSNTGYTLLATVVERATGTKFASYADEQIFKPLGMTVTHFHTDARRLVKQRALGYGGRDGAWTLDTPINERAGAGGLYTSITELQKWDENFYSGAIGGATILKQLQTRGVLNDGKTIAYAWGLQIGEYGGLPIVEHSGSLGGYRAHIFRVPSEHTSVALLCNVSTVNTTTLARRVVSVVLKGRLTAPAPAVPGGTAGSILGRVPDSTTAAANREYAGTFYSEELGARFTITARGDEVLVQRENDAAPAVLRMDGPADHFTFRGYTVKFVRDSTRQVTGFTVDAGRVRGIVFERRER